MYSMGWGEDCYGGHPCYSEFIEPFGIQMHGRGFDMSHATAKQGPPPSTADARLIAAAPQLLEKLSALVEAMRGAAPAGAWCEWINTNLHEAELVIAAVEGK